jgi:hypothetical protein
MLTRKDVELSIQYTIDYIQQKGFVALACCGTDGITSTSRSKDHNELHPGIINLYATQHPISKYMEIILVDNPSWHINMSYVRRNIIPPVDDFPAWMLHKMFYGYTDIENSAKATNKEDMEYFASCFEEFKNDTIFNLAFQQAVDILIEDGFDVSL